jgi:hypothetical protein
MYQGGELHLHCGWDDSISSLSTKFMQTFQDFKHDQSAWITAVDLALLLEYLGVIDFLTAETFMDRWAKEKMTT